MNDNIHAPLAVENLEQRQVQKPEDSVKARVDEVSDRLSQAEDLLSDATATLRALAASGIARNQAKSAELAIQRIDDAVNLFQVATTCVSKSWNVL